MTDNDFHARRTELSNTFAAAGAELLDYMGCAGALAAIPSTQQYVVAGSVAAIRAQLDTVNPQRRMRHGDRPELDLYFGPETGQPRRWAALITSTGHGILQEYGSAFEHAQPGQEVLEVMEILPGAPAIANKATEEGELPEPPRPQHMRSLGYDGGQMRQYARDAIAADRASRQGSSVPDCFANKAEVEPEHPQFDASKGIYWFSILLKCARLLDVPDEEPIPSGVLTAVERLVSRERAGHGENDLPCDFELKRLHRLLEIVGVSGVSELDAATSMACFWSLIGEITKKLAATPPSTTGARTAPTDEELLSVMDPPRAALKAEDWDPVTKRPKVKPVGASTALTDERIWRMWQEDPCPGGSVKEMIISHTRAVLREVAAQAGQVAVPGWISVDDRLPDGRYCLATYRDRAGKLRIIRAMYVRQYEVKASGEECDGQSTEYNETDDTEYLKAGWLECIDNWGEYSSVYVCEGEVTHWMPLPPLPGAQASTAGERPEQQS